MGRRIVAVAVCGRCGLGTLPPSVPGEETVDIVSRLKARSRADWKRRSRDFSRQRRTSRSRAGGVFGSFSVRSGGSSLRIAPSVSIDESRLNARAPLSISYRIAPKEKMSERVSTGSPRTCSGDM